MDYSIKLQNIEKIGGGGDEVATTNEEQSISDVRDRLVSSIVSKEEGVYKLDCRLWNGVEYSGTRSIISEHMTLEDAKDEFERMQEEYPGVKDVVLLVDDIQDTE